MLWLERRIAVSIPHDVDPSDRPAVEHFVETSLAAMPPHLRLGVGSLSFLLGAAVRLRGRGADPRAIAETVAGWETSRISPIRQYARLLSSLVLFAEQELAAAT